MSESVKWYWLTIAAIFASLIYLLAPVLMPFLSAALLAYIANPIVGYLSRWKFPRTLSVILLFIVFFCLFLLAILLLIPMLIDQIRWFIGKVPAMIAWLQNVVVPKVNQWLDVNIQLDFEMIKRVILSHWQQASDVLASVLTTVSTSGAAFLAWMINLILIPVVTFYLLRDWPRLWQRGRDLLPRKIEPVVSGLVQECNLVLGSFFRGQILVMISLGFIYSLGLRLLGLNVALLIGFLTGVLSFVPYLGLIIGLVSASIAAFFQFNDLLHVALVWLVFLVGQSLESVVLTPLLVGERIGLHPVAVIFAVLAGGQLFGFVGILLALPTAAVIVVLLRYLKHQYQSSRLYDEERGLKM